MRRCLTPLLLVGTALALGGPADGQTGSPGAPEFPPGQFSDGQTYKMSDLRGKVVVLYFYEKG